MGKVPIYKPILILIISFAVVTGLGERYAHAQFSDSGLASILPLNSFQSFFGPLIPPEGLSSTFRSELGLSGGMASLLKANVKNGNTTFNLHNNGTITHNDAGGNAISETYVEARSLDGAPSVFQFYSKTRLWRLAFNASYAFFDTYSRRSTDDGMFFSGPILGGDLDLIHNGWLAAGLAANFYLNEPRFVFNDPSIARGATNSLYTDFCGSAPSNIGVYVRYTPPEIWNFPLHLEAHYYMPFGGSKWTNWGFALAFRPQIYRFDLSARLKLENQYLNISGTDPHTTDPNWQGEFSWSILGMDVGVYF